MVTAARIASLLLIDRIIDFSFKSMVNEAGQSIFSSFIFWLENAAG